MMPKDNDKEKVKELILAGSELAGSAVAGAIGFLAAGPSGAALLSVSGAVITKAITLFAQKHIAQRERERVGATAAFLIDSIGKRLRHGDNPNYKLFDTTDSKATDAEQLLEGVFLKAKDAYIEKKCPYFGYFYANIIFEQNLSSSTAFHLLEVLTLLSYRQIILISLLNDSNIDMEQLRSKTHSNIELESLKREEMDLHGNDLGNIGVIASVGSWVDTLSPLGAMIARVSGLNFVPQKDKLELSALIKSASD
jgi:hypothetical protein